jgi:hypothetical protein
MQYQDEFKKLSLMEKRTLLFGEGKLMFTQQQGECKTSLFDLNGEFFEVTHTLPGARLLKIEHINDYEKVQAYYNSNKF